MDDVEVGRGTSEYHELTKSTIIEVRNTTIGAPNFGCECFYSDLGSFNSGTGVILENCEAFNADVGAIFEDAGVPNFNISVRNFAFDVILSAFLSFF